jgi:hypothetical protein
VPAAMLARSAAAISCGVRSSIIATTRRDRIDAYRPPQCRRRTQQPAAQRVSKTQPRQCLCDKCARIDQFAYFLTSNLTAECLRRTQSRGKDLKTE